MRPSKAYSSRMSVLIKKKITSREVLERTGIVPGTQRFTCVTPGDQFLEHRSKFGNFIPKGPASHEAICIAQKHGLFGRLRVHTNCSNSWYHPFSISRRSVSRVRSRYLIASIEVRWVHGSWFGTYAKSSRATRTTRMCT